jgi:hypothetical protein
MITFKTTYKFENGTTAEFTIQKDAKNPIAKCEWSCELNKKNISPLLDEYAKKCVPFVYQQIADFICQSILWIDKNGHYPPQEFKPQNAN